MLLIVNLALPSVVTVKAPSIPVSVTVAFVLPTEILVTAAGVCQLGAEPEPLLVKICPLVPKLVPPIPKAPKLLIVNLAPPSVVTVKEPFEPVSETTAEVSPTEMLVPAAGACQLGAEPEPLLVRI